MNQNVTKARLKAGETVFGVFTPFPSPTVVELLGLGGFDFVIIDCEHGPMSPEMAENMVRAAQLSGATPIVRVAQNVQQVILRYMDTGAQGIHIPMVNTKADAEAVVRSVKYPPIGVRGLAGVRAAEYGAKQSLGEYVKTANQETLVVCHVETMQAVQNLPEITTVEGLDVIFIGPTDLSSAMGLPGQTANPAVQEAIAQAIKTIIDGGKIAGTMARDVASARQFMDMGVRYITTASVAMILGAARDFNQKVRS
ncbi:MAG: HpcH/HpaI aldolase family protein [Chloroflexota bacterium]